jgi:hypothetical protein
MLQSAKLIASGLATISIAGAGVGIGTVFGSRLYSDIHSVTKSYVNIKIPQMKFDIDNKNKSGILSEYSLNPYWVSGFSDAESNFHIQIHKKNGGIGWQVQAIFQICFHKIDLPI